MDYYDYRDAIFASDLTANARLLALAISYHYNWKDSKVAWPSNKTLAEETGLSIRTIIRAKNELVSTGHLVSQRRFNDSSVYMPVLPGHSGTYPVSDLLTNNEYNNEINNEYKNSNEFLHVINSNLNQEETILLGTNERPFEYERTAAAGPAGRGDSLTAESMRHAGRDDSADARESKANQELVRAFQSDWLD